MTSDILWTHQYPGLNNQTLLSVTQTPDGGFLIFGQDYTSNGPAYQLKLDQNGNVAWNRTIAKNPGSTLTRVVANPDGGFTFLGMISDVRNTTGNSGIPETPTDLYVLKTDTKLAKQWDGDYGHHYPDAILRTADGGCILTGYTSDTHIGTASGGYLVGTYDYKAETVIKIDQAGKEQWELAANLTDQQSQETPRIDGMLQTADGGYLLAGHGTSYATASGNPLDSLRRLNTPFVAKLDETGRLQWNKTYAGSDNIAGTYPSLAQAPDGGYLLAGETDQGMGNLSLLKLDRSGNLLWNRTYSNGNLESFVQTPDGGFLLGGYSTHDFNYSGFVVKADSAGKEQWTWKNNDSLAWVKAVGQTGDNGFYTAGVDYIPWFDNSYYAGHNFTIYRYGPADLPSGKSGVSPAAPGSQGSNGCCLTFLLFPVLIGITFAVKKK